MIEIASAPTRGDDPTSVLAIGGSHLAAIVAGHKQKAATGNAPFRLAKLQLRSEPFREVVDENGDAIPAVREEVARLLHTEQPTLILGVLGGNGHHVLGMVRRQKPFDFVLPSSPNEDPEPGAEIIPFSLITALVARHVPATQIRAIRRLTHGLPMAHVSPPPPIGSEQHIREHPGIFADRIAEYGLSSARHRYKIWRAYVTALSDLCRAEGITFLDAPAESQDADGFLRSEFWGNDPTHANPRYGELVLQQLAGLVGASPRENAA
jgi:hypothetical protein